MKRFLGVYNKNNDTDTTHAEKYASSGYHYTPHTTHSNSEHTNFIECLVQQCVTKIF
jgi:hypothetical protein